MVVMEAPYLDDETILKKLPNITPDEVAAILSAKDTASQSRFVRSDSPEEPTEPEDGDA